jgi:hypothetical protein
VEEQRRAFEQAERDAYNNSIVNSSIETQETTVSSQFRREYPQLLFFLFFVFFFVCL